MRKPRSIDDIIAEAKEWIENDATISVYFIENGRIYRRHLNPELAYQRIMGEMSDAFHSFAIVAATWAPKLEKLGQSFQNMAKSIDQSSLKSRLSKSDTV